MAEPAADESVWLRHTARRRRDLRRMQHFATGLLALMGALYVLTTALESRWGWLAYPRAFAEAGVVGACADWFAVVALFRHPLGVPIPHTAIIRHNKQRIGEALGRFIAKNFLAPKDLIARIEEVDAAGWIADWLQAPGHAALVVDRARDAAPPLLGLLDRDKIRAFGRGVILTGLDSIALAPLLARGLAVLIAQGHFDTAFDLAADAARRFIERHREAIRKRTVKKSAGALVGWIDTRLTEAAIDELLDKLAQARAKPDHPWRTEGRKALERLITRLAEDPIIEAQFERFKTKALSQDVVAGYLDGLVNSLEAKVGEALTHESGLVSDAVERAMLALGQGLSDDEAIRLLINQWMQRLVLGALVAGREGIGAFVTGVVTRWDTDTLVERIELEFGRDLQYIRLNGTVVGGLVGLIIYTVTQLAR